ncbi:DEHA2E06732p [Debaryomyces hansenii CBS767]|uniref:DEHA2E06732p n=1 Tax=Debaryomyces hansenii (strain ATCC 36239 / CBS 767 / BCRC 21394 / JCM 1990 / NBRC 0083 / IGC 2968) TaxID=284592 RepID=Q6BQB9_DEBHA|nr:DEHA2E06732p [Debaryomyces hansenii CBS767]CAG87831.1 DEHA2E06732p [Debaryomyces hansenii CBS767]|eukprot:XP_459601.1 DEHA2E06732p [Debaryomyces hansenii CBS767]
MSERKSKVLVVGSGGVGAIGALCLTLNDKADVTLVVRSDYAKVNESGYSIKSVTYGEHENWKPRHIAKSVADASERFGEFDFILLTTKNIPDGPITCEDIIRPAVTPRTAIILLQNGLGIEKPMIEQFPHNVILSGVSLIGSSNINCVVSNMHKDQIYLGAWSNPNIENHAEKEQCTINEFTRIYSNEKYNRVIIDENVQKTRWEKLVYNSVLNTTTTVVNLDINRCQIAGANNELFRPAMREVIAIAASEGIEISPDTIERFIHLGDGLFYSPSMCVDARKKQLFELEVILGNPLKIAEANGVETPMLRTLYTLLTMVQFRIKEERGIIKIDENEYNKINSDSYPDLLKK